MLGPIPTESYRMNGVSEKPSVIIMRHYDASVLVVLLRKLTKSCMSAVNDNYGFG